jgi:hypothetical protein
MTAEHMKNIAPEIGLDYPAMAKDPKSPYLAAY